MNCVSTCFFLSLLVAVQADYLFELDLQSYRNPGGKTFTGACCEVEATNPADMTCLTIDTCDPIFNIRLQNFNTLSFIGRDYSLGVFPNKDSITFPTCGPIMSESSNTVSNPLRFTFPATAFGPTNTIRIIMDISHVEGSSTTPIVSNFVQEISRIPGTNPSFSSSITVAAPAPNALEVQFSYRLTCTPQFCGNACLQTLGCSDISKACPASCDASIACMNGGTCENGMCLCAHDYTGSLCQTITVDFTTNKDIYIKTPPTSDIASTSTSDGDHGETSTTTTVTIIKNRGMTLSDAKTTINNPTITTSGFRVLGTGTMIAEALLLFSYAVL